MKDYFSTLSMEELERQFEESKYYKDEGAPAWQPNTNSS